jgi:DNA-binding MarR family transcriptional regulator
MSEWLKSAQQKCNEYRELMSELQNACTSTWVLLTGEQVLLILGLGQEGRCTVKNLPYNGRNASYNVKKLSDMALINYDVCAQDHRVRYVSLTEKGKRLSSEIIRHLKSVDASILK